MEGMPDELQLLPDTKKRESDAKIVQMLVETLVLLTSTRFGRDTLRHRKVYPIVQKLHLASVNDQVNDVIERLVNMLMRDEEKPRIQLVESSDESDAEVEGLL